MFRYHIYRLNAEGVQLECIDTGENGEEEQPVANHWILPSSDFHGLWESLVYDCKVKENVSFHTNIIVVISFLFLPLKYLLIDFHANSTGFQAA